MMKKDGKKLVRKINNYKTEIGTMVKNPTSMYLMVSGYLSIDDSIDDMERVKKSLRKDLNRFCKNTSYDVWSMSNRFYFDMDFADKPSNDYFYFAIELGLFFNKEISVRDKYIIDESEVVSSLILEYLEENRVIYLQPTKPKIPSII